MRHLAVALQTHSNWFLLNLAFSFIWHKNNEADVSSNLFDENEQ